MLTWRGSAGPMGWMHGVKGRDSVVQLDGADDENNLTGSVPSCQLQLASAEYNILSLLDLLLALAVELLGSKYYRFCDRQLTINHQHATEAIMC